MSGIMFSGLYKTFTTALVALLIVCDFSGDFSCQAFEYNGYCQRMCMWGRGGNLCKCSAVHFAGKRDNERSNDGGLGQAYRPIPGLHLPENMDADYEKEQEVLQEHPSILPSVHHMISTDENSDENWPNGVDRMTERLAILLERSPLLRATFRKFLSAPRRKRHALFMDAENRSYP